MKLTPLEIRKQEFKKALRGFDPIEVQTFLEMVSEQYEELLEENKKQSRRLIELETRLHSYQESEKTLRETLLNMQEVKKQSDENSRRQAEMIQKEAELKAFEILENARKEARKIREEINWLKAQKESFINRIRHVLVSQIELLSVMEIDDVLPEETRATIDTWKKRKGLQRAAGKADTPPLPPDRNPPSDPSGEGKLQASPERPGAAEERRVILKMDDPEVSPPDSPHPAPTPDESTLTEEDIEDFFKKGIKIDDLIKNINKKDFEQ